MAKYIENDSKVVNLIGNGTEITGDINSNSDIRIDGKLKGNLFTSGKLVIGESGEVHGEVKCKNSDVSGKIEGKIIVEELLSLKTASVIKGDIITNKLAIEPGAMFTGNCNMNGTPKYGETKEKLGKG